MFVQLQSEACFQGHCFIWSLRHPVPAKSNAPSLSVSQLAEAICRLGKQLAFRVRLQGVSLTLVTDLKRGVRGMWSEPFLFPFGSG